jgi:hypothetical protein
VVEISAGAAHSLTRRPTNALHRTRTGALLYCESYTLSPRRFAPVSFKRWADACNDSGTNSAICAILERDFMKRLTISPKYPSVRQSMSLTPSVVSLCVIAALLVPSLLSDDRKAQKVCRPASFLRTVPAESTLGKMMIASNEQQLKEAQDRYHDVNWLRWVVVSTDSSTTYLLDRDTPMCEFSKSCECTVWMWTLNTPPQGNFKSWKELLNLQCESNRFRRSRSVGYLVDGGTTETSSQADWESPIPDSVGELLFNESYKAIATDFRFFPVHLPPPTQP